MCCQLFTLHIIITEQENNMLLLMRQNPSFIHDQLCEDKSLDACTQQNTYCLTFLKIINRSKVTQKKPIV